jgi:hypothetical protein
MSPEQLSAAWISAKQAEKVAVEARRSIEDALVAAFNVSTNSEGTHNFEIIENTNLAPFKLKIVSKLNRKIDGDKLQELATENGLEEHLSSLFRWTPAINTAIWKATSSQITDILDAAITTTPGRPIFSITLDNLDAV